jgi:hypothetical protein
LLPSLQKQAFGANPINLIAEYEVEKTEPLDCEPSEINSYWANRTHRWPHLAALARDLLNIPATSAATGRAFSE